MFPVGLGYAARFFVGNYMGKRRPKTAKQFGDWVQLIALGWAGIMMVLLYFFESPIVRNFTHQEDVMNEISRAWPMFIIFTLFDNTQAIAGSLI